MKPKQIISTITSSLIIVSMLFPAHMVSANAISKRETHRESKTIRIQLDKSFDGKTYSTYESLPQEVKNAINSTYAFKKNGWEGTLNLEEVKFTPVVKSKVTVYKPPETKKVTTTRTQSESYHEAFGKKVASFANSITVSMLNPFTNKWQYVSAVKEGTPKTGEQTSSSLYVKSDGRWANYDKKKNEAFGIMSNSETYMRPGIRWETADAWSVAPKSGTKIYLGAFTNPFNKVWVNRTAKEWQGYLKPSMLSSARWVKEQYTGLTTIPADANTLALYLGGYYSKNEIGNDFIFKRDGFNWAFKSEEGNFNRYRRGMHLTYKIDIWDTEKIQTYAYTFTKPREIDYEAYTEWVVNLTYSGSTYDMRTNNFYVDYVKFNPGNVIIPNNKSRVEQKTSVTFDIGYSVYPASNIQASPNVTVYQGDTAIWSGSVPVNPGSKTRRTVSLGTLNFAIGHNPIRVVVNPQRRITERKPMGADAYDDNSKENSVRGIESDRCIIYSNVSKRTVNTWDERWSIITQVGTVATDAEGHKYANVISRNEDVQDKSYREEYKITEVYFRSKYTKDNKVNDLPSKGEGWQKITNGSVGTIKAGYGFEIFARTVYSTNRNEGVSITETQGNPYSSTKYGDGHASFKMISPSVGETITPSALSMTMQSGSGSNICILLEETSKSGNWWNQTKTFEVPLKGVVQGEDERKVYTSETSKPGVYNISIATPAPASPSAFSGYEAESPTGGGGMKPKLYDYLNFQLEILGQDDLKSHINN